MLATIEVSGDTVVTTRNGGTVFSAVPDDSELDPQPARNVRLRRTADTTERDKGRDHELPDVLIGLKLVASQSQLRLVSV